MVIKPWLVVPEPDCIPRKPAAAPLVEKLMLPVALWLPMIFPSINAAPFKKRIAPFDVDVEALVREIFLMILF